MKIFTTLLLSSEQGYFILYQKIRATNSGDIGFILVHLIQSALPFFIYRKFEMPKGVYKRKPFTEIHKIKIGKASKKRKHSDETKIKIGKARSRKIEVICQYCEESFKVKPSAIKNGGGKYHTRKCYYLSKRGIKHSEKSIQKMRESTIKHLTSGRQIFKDTLIEIAIEKELKRVNLNYKKQVAICKVGVVDFFLPDCDIIIECDGEYWHSKINHKKRDATKDLVWMFNNYKVFRFWEYEINESPEKCIKKILKYIHSRKEEPKLLKKETTKLLE